MASSTPKPQKRLGDFLNEQQEPFILEVYLSERDCSKRWSFSEDSTSNTSEKPTTISNKNKKARLPFFQVLKALYNKLSFNKESKNILTNVHDHSYRYEGVPEPIVQFSSDRSSTMFNSCSDIDEEGTSMLSRRDQHLFCSHFHTLCSMEEQRRQRQRSKEDGIESQRKIPVQRVPNVNEDVSRRMQQRIRSCGVILPKRITDDSLLSAAIWSSLLDQSMKRGNCTRELEVLLPGTNDVSQILKSKRLLHRIKKMLFDCVKDIAVNLPTEQDRNKGYNKQLMGPIETGKVNRQRTKQWDHLATGGANPTNLLTLDYFDSIMEWSNFEPHVKDISFDITDSILDNIKNEIVLEMIGSFTQNI